jgi:hypothetical protein
LGKLSWLIAIILAMSQDKWQNGLALVALQKRFDGKVRKLNTFPIAHHIYFMSIVVKIDILMPSPDKHRIARV